MPNYDFKCEKCGHNFSEIVSINATEEERNNQKCPKCGESSPRNFNGEAPRMYMTTIPGFRQRKL